MKNSVTLADFRTLEEFNDHEMVIGFTDTASKLRGYIGIHSTKLGPALGGTRFITYQSDEEALKDVLNLSQAMSYKCALANLPYGGGKGVMVLDKNMLRDEALAAYGRFVENLHGLFKTGTDVGISDQDVSLMGEHTQHMLGLTEADRSGLSTSNCAALGVFYAMKSALIELDKTDNFAGKRVAIKGIGKLGGELARLLDEAGAEIIASDVDTKALREFTKRLPKAKVVETRDIHKQVVDIYAPCALGNEFTDVVISELNTRAIVGGANNQLPTQAAGDKLFAQGILYAPDYVVNSGGLIYVADELEPGGFNKQRVLERTKAIQDTATDIFIRAKQENLPTHAIADTIARERIQK